MICQACGVEAPTKYVAFYGNIGAFVVFVVSLVGARVISGSEPTLPSQRVHAFYYPWYGNPASDAGFSHWNHGVAVRDGPPRHFPGGADIGANFYPLMGCYSSNSSVDLERHMRFLRRAGVGVVSVSWWGEGSFTDRALPGLFAAAEQHGIRVAFHIEPHLGSRRRDAPSTRNAIVGLIDRFGASPALYRDATRGDRPLFYIYDSYLTKASEWATILAPERARTIRDSQHDALVIGLWVKQREEQFFLDGHFDGFYTYFATEGFTYGSTPRNWTRLARWARGHGKLFVPSVGPGYDDTRIRPWNGRNTRGRGGGKYYDAMFEAAIAVEPEIVSITSFNEWHEGTQIEPAVPKKVGEYTYEDYRPRSPYAYLDRTAHWAGVLEGRSGEHEPAHFENVHVRGSLRNSRLEFERNKKGHVAFMGGSITEMDGYRPMVCRDLQRRFPATEFTFTDAGIASTCSTTGAFRLDEDVLSKGPVDLLFLEFAVNDDQDAGHDRRGSIRGMEGILRHARRHNPRIDVVVTYFVNPGMLEMLRRGEDPVSIASHDEVVKHYEVPSIHLAAEVARLVGSRELTWKEFGGTHPAPTGNAICAGMIDTLFDRAWSDPLPDSARASAHAMPSRALDLLNYEHGRFVDPRRAGVKNGWTYRTPDWKQLKGSCRARFAKEQLLCAERPGASLSLDFSGTCVGVFVLAGPDAGTVKAKVDAGRWHTVDLYHRFSAGLHYPRTVLLVTELAPGRHMLTLEVAEEKNTASIGHAVRILEFAVNGSSP